MSFENVSLLRAMERKRRRAPTLRICSRASVLKVLRSCSVEVSKE